MKTDKDIAAISLFVNDAEIVNGFGQSLPVADTIRQWAQDSERFYKYLNAGEFPEDYSIFVPDFWHIAYGRAKCLTPEDAKTLWDSSVVLRNDARLVEDWTEMVVQPHPGTRIGIKPGKVFAGAT